MELLTNGPFGVLLISFCLVLLKILIADNQRVVFLMKKKSPLFCNIFLTTW